MKKLIIYTGIVTSFLLASANFTQAQTKEHKPISSQGKGAIIGGAGGAVVGGIIGHNVGGALIGGAIGAGGGYIIGNEHRKAVEKKKRAAYRQAYYRKHGHYPNAYVYKKPTK
ncbi:YMGG-like glycine zipper-containing protein [Mucilaginibacter panaciglaebae]|uniref:YMGG-like Gly-zipper domain-containing protein n=1 Tax=Mucilaginibacter panaciglaebae TaxID=502331 RepID=A0ABP7WH42_9SPHI